nr:ribonuclease H-like domain-containing protein [Tanacetum cinerariifolium]
MSQNGSFIADYYHKLNALWKKFNALVELPRCTCHATDGFKKHNQLMKLMQFLMGLDDTYMQIRSSILSKETLPDVRSAYAIISKKESHRTTSGNISETSQRSRTSVFTANVPNRGNYQRSHVSNNIPRPSNNVRPNDNRNKRTARDSNLVCKNCGFNGHTIDRCFKIMGYPLDFGKKKAGQNFKGKNVSNNAVGSSSSSGFSGEQLLGHPADQVLDVLRPNLLFENKKSDVVCDICQRAKQTREPFPLSDHVSTLIIEYLVKISKKAHILELKRRNLKILTLTSYTSMITPYNLCTGFFKFTNMALPPRDQRHQYLRFEGLGYKDADIIDFEERLGRIYGREIHKLGGVRRRMSWREFILGMGLHTAEEIKSVGFGAYRGETPSYTSIRDLMLRLCHRLIACNIAGRCRALEKVIVTDLFYLRGMDVGSVNILYLLARYLRLFASKRKRRICEELDDTWSWVASRPDRQQVVAAGASEVAKDALVVYEGASAVPAPVQAPQAPPAARPARTMA